MTEMFGEAWSPMSVPDLAPDDDDEWSFIKINRCNDIFLSEAYEQDVFWAEKQRWT